jgi:hypothetical protein
MYGLEETLKIPSHLQISRTITGPKDDSLTFTRQALDLTGLFVFTEDHMLWNLKKKKTQSFLLIWQQPRGPWDLNAEPGSRGGGLWGLKKDPVLILRSLAATPFN